MTRASNGDYIVAGSSDQDSSHSWAVRLEQPSGRKIWEYIDGGTAAWGTKGESPQRIESIVEMPDGKTILCGTRVLSHTITPYFAVLDPNGAVIRSGTLDERPPRSAYFGIGCARWGTEFAVGSTFVGLEGEQFAKSSLFGRFDLDGNRSWEKASDFYGYEGMVSSGEGGFLLFSSAGSDVIRLNSKAELVSRYPLPPDSSKRSFVRSRQPGSGVTVAYATQERSEIVELDEAMQKVRSVRKVDDFTVARAIVASDGSTVLFGSVFHKGLLSGGPQAAIAILPPKGSVRVLYLDQKWIVDAIPTDNPREFAFVDNEYVNPEIKWISLKWLSLSGASAAQ